MYRVIADPERNRVVTFFGDKFDYAVDDFTRDLKQAIYEARSEAGAFDLISDFSQLPVMDQERSVNSQEVVAWCVANGLRRAANVMGSVVQKMQVRRLSENNDGFAYFETMGEAEHWLDTALKDAA